MRLLQSTVVTGTTSAPLEAQSRNAPAELSTWQLLPFYFGAMSGPMGGGIIPVLFAVLMDAFGVDRSVLSLAIPAYMFPYAIVQLFSGGISDLTSRRTSLLIGFGGFGVATVFAGLAPTYGIFLLAQVLQGATNAFTSPILMATLGDIVPERRTSRVIGFFNTWSLAGTMCAPLLGGFLGDISWRVPFIVIGVLNWLLTVWLVIWFRRYGAEVPRRSRSMSLREDVREMASALGIQIVWLAALSFLASNAIRGSVYLFADYLDQSWGISVAAAGLVLAVYGLAGLLIGPFSGFIMDRVGLYRSVAASMIGVALSLVLMGISSSPAGFVLGNFLLGAASILAWTGLSTLAVNLAPEHRGAASSLFGSARFLAMAISPLWFTAMYQSISTSSIFYVAALSAVLLLVPLAALRTHQTEGVSRAS
jgi:predicted MFS family arabinose efflux permease